ncbi:MAG: RNA 3'-phosphate cyclase [Desulfuromonadales bacterium]|nr:MAG: RNA 3'-phosphate cyclase [Desulfuromonadales bacterium]
MIEIDGSHGEGGGQILRTALSLSCLYQKPFRIYNIRKARKKPGLMPQHLTAVRAAQLISAAEVSGGHSGSTEIIFSPHDVKEGHISFDIGTAGSTSLVLQTLIPALVFGKGKSTVTLKGGTHVPFSPSFQYLAEVFAPILQKLGIDIELTISSYGFYPRGGGEITAEIAPVQSVNPLRLMKRGRITGLTGYSAVGNLPFSIAERQKNAALATVHDHLHTIECPVQLEVQNVPTPGHGTFLFIKMTTEHSVAGFTALGERGKRAETVGKEAVLELIGYCSSGAPVDQHLADQIVVYLSLCAEESEFAVSCVTQHLLTNLWVISQFLKGIRHRVDGEPGKPGTVRIN